jgi:predicted regulator of Ras-like GTPase activity (Roadblock/LC7/MglB family)
MLASMDATQAIADLTEISPQVQSVVVVAPDGGLTGSNLPNEAAARRLADGARRLLDAAESLRPGVAQLEAATTAGSVFAVRDGERLIAATTTPEPTVGLVFYDLKTCLRSVTEPGDGSSESAESGKEPEPEPEAKPRRRAKKKIEEDGGDATP